MIEESNKENNNKKYLPVNLITIRANTLGSFSIFIKVLDNYVLYHTNGEQLTQEIIKKLINNNVNIVYILKSDVDNYNNYLVKNLTKILHDPDISPNKKAEIAHSSLTNIAQSLFEKPSLNTLTLFKSSISKITDFILVEEEAINNLIRLASLNYKISTHSINVGMYALGLAKILLGNDPKHNLHEIAAGFFLHDIGRCHIPSVIMNKTIPLTHEEWKIVKQHPAYGFKLLNKLNIMNNETKVIVLQHHERRNGKGYPRGLKDNEIHMYSKICSIADVFEALTSYRPYRSSDKKNISSFEALMTLKNEMSDEFEPYFFQNFVQMFSNTLNNA